MPTVNMAGQRAVTLNIDAVARTEMQRDTDRNEWFVAIGYLSTWNMTFPEVTINRGDGDTDMVAVYRTHKGDIGYVISAVWHGDHYGFHS